MEDFINPVPKKNDPKGLNLNTNIQIFRKIFKDVFKNLTQPIVFHFFINFNIFL